MGKLPLLCGASSSLVCDKHILNYETNIKIFSLLHVMADTTHLGSSSIFLMSVAVSYENLTKHYFINDASGPSSNGK